MHEGVVGFGVRELLITDVVAGLESLHPRFDAAGNKKQKAINSSIQNELSVISRKNFRVPKA